MIKIEPIIEERDGVYRFRCFSSGVVAAFSGRQYPRAKFNDFLTANGLASRELVMVHQVHGTVVLAISLEEKPVEKNDADGLITNHPAFAIGIKTADCLPVFLEDPVHRAIGMVHAGWRGLHAGIFKKVVQAMQARYGTLARDLTAAIGPSIRGCCYEVGPEFQTYFPNHFTAGRRRGEGPGGMLDLTEAALSDLRETGISPDRLVDCKVCTACRNDLFYSYRKDKTTERMLSIMSLCPIDRK